jgi:serine/threonine protein kinase
MALAPGLEITGSIRLVRKLGEGGMGSVWAADHTGLRTQVAVKFMSEHLAMDGGAAARFSREASAAAQIKSPHVVQVFDHGLLDDRIPYIVMELLEGENLSSFIQRHGGTLSPRVTAQILTQACRALGKAHAQGVIHRDIKPDNLFVLESDGEIFVKVLDFGIAKQAHGIHNVTSTGALLGTPYYMSPEQMLSAKHVDPRSDLWAVGVVAYQSITGKLPFQGETFAGVAVAISQGQFSLPYAEGGLGSPELDAWFARALAKDANQRFASARELSDAFAAAAGSALSLSGDSGVVPATSVATSPKTFHGVATTMSVGAKRGKRGARTALALLALFAGLGALAIVVFRGGDGKTEALTSESSQPSSGAPHNEPSPIDTAPPVAPKASVTPVVPPSSEPAERAFKKAGSASASAAAPQPQQPRKAGARARTTGPASPQTASATSTPVITDRGF